MNYKLSIMDKPVFRYSLYLFVAFVISVIEFTSLNLLEIEGVKPDLLLIFCVWISMKEGRFVGTIFGFANGLILDMTSAAVIGTNAFAKTIASFLAGTFHQKGKEERLIKSFSFLFIILVSSFVHNMIYYFFYIKVIEEDFWDFLIIYGIASSLYTAILAIIPMLWVNNKSIKIH